MLYLPRDDPEVAHIVQREEARIENTLDLIAAENHADDDQDTNDG